jgi:hypothetical protein
MNVWEFKIAIQTEEQLAKMTELSESGASPQTMLAEVENVQFKTLYAITETEEEAIKRVDAYVAATKYADIENNKIV